MAMRAPPVLQWGGADVPNLPNLTKIPLLWLPRFILSKPQTRSNREGNPQLLNHLSETQYKCSQGDPFEKAGGGGAVGSAALDFEGGTPAS